VSVVFQEPVMHKRKVSKNMMVVSYNYVILFRCKTSEDYVWKDDYGVKWAD
jgi:hypothetical protein